MGTLIFIFIIIGSRTAFLGGADMILNTICIYLLCPYYPDGKYYAFYCKSCIRCCDKTNYAAITQSMIEKTADTADTDQKTSNLEPTTTSQTERTAVSGYTNTN